MSGWLFSNSLIAASVTLARAASPHQAKVIVALPLPPAAADEAAGPEPQAAASRATTLAIRARAACHGNRIRGVLIDRHLRLLDYDFAELRDSAFHRMGSGFTICAVGDHPKGGGMSRARLSSACGGPGGQRHSLHRFKNVTGA